MIDVTTAVITMSYFGVDPRIGHVETIHGYLCKFKCRIARFRIEELDMPAMPDTHYNWEELLKG